MAYQEEYYRDASLAVAEIRVGTAGAPTTLSASIAEVNRVADVSGRLVAAGSSLSVTEALHDGKTILLDTLAGSVCTLPAASGSGARFKFQVSVVPTSNAHVVKVANGSDIIQGLILGMTDNSAAVLGYRSADTSDTITLDGSTMGGAERGDWIEVEDVAANLWLVRGNVSQSGNEATPFSAGV